jgi:hypothetical protein
MSFLAFLKRRKESSPAREKSDRGFLGFAKTSEVIQAESLLEAQGRGIRGLRLTETVRGAG